VLGAIALSTTGAPQWSRSLSLFSVYGLVALYDLARAVLRRLESYETDLVPPSSHLSRPAPLARDRQRPQRP
jgi:hypothetical protein